ncbi:B3/4 domain-containing protein [Streptomyces albus]|uniref:B3/B4 domain-containing protein n=1 Tax=Streptomyces albus TaxID=1888 RepID=UPI0004CBDC80|nr:phenylalanine--tRNA ligase beta subunit-related protein [Streptomyces albus]
MYFTHADAVWDAHPGLRALVVATDGVLGAESDPLRTEKLAAETDRRQQGTTEAEMPEIAAWREAFSQMGLKPTQYRCASEALLRRYRKSKDMPSFHPLVDYLNFASMASAIPIAAFDVARVSEGITVRPAEGTETYVTFQGDTEHPAPGEIVFADRAGNAHSRRWTYRQSSTSVVSSGSDRVLIVAEAHHASAEQDLISLEAELKAGLPALGVRITTSALIGPGRRRLDFSYS